ncbi:MAG: DUF3466 family protein [Phycisphaerales bacterium]|nr:DUF3466 family protein [Phycisphaerales bacterium]
MTFRIAHSVGCVAIGLCSAARAQITYTVTEITTLGGPSSNALALNNNGAVVGISNTAAGPNVARAFRWINGTIIDLGTLGGPSAEAFDINDAGQITGRAETADSIEFNETFHTFLWEDGTMTDLGTSGGQSSRGWAINSQGVVVGASQICWYDPKNPGGPCFPVGNEYTFIWDGTTMSDLGGLFGSSDSSALGVNSLNEIAGQSIVVSGFSTPRHAALWIDGQAIDLGTLGGVNSWAFDINDAGLVLGFSDIASNLAHHPFIYDINTGIMTDMGLPQGFFSAEALAINSAGHFVGIAFNCCQAAAYVYDGKAMHDLNQLIPPGSGWTLTEGTDINDAGWIVGQGTHNGAQRGFLLKPVISGCGPDINCDGAVNVIDLLAVIAGWGACPSPPAQCPADIIPNGIVDINDLLAVISNWG